MEKTFLLKIFLLILALATISCSSSKNIIGVPNLAATCIYKNHQKSYTYGQYLAFEAHDSRYDLKSNKEVSRILKMECDQSILKSCHYLGALYHDAGMELDANKYFTILCDKGDGRGCHIMGVRLSPGFGQFKTFSKNVSKANEYFYEGCEKGDLRACRKLAQLETKELEKIKSDYLLRKKRILNSGVVILFNESIKNFPGERGLLSPTQQFKEVRDKSGNVLFTTHHTTLKWSNLPKVYNQLDLPKGEYSIVVECKNRTNKFSSLVKSTITVNANERLFLSCEYQGVGYIKETAALLEKDESNQFGIPISRNMKLIEYGRVKL